MGRAINNGSDISTEETNTTGELTRILQVVPPDGTKLKLLNFQGPGQSRGFPIFASLQDSTPNDLPSDTEIVLQVLMPDQITPTRVSVRQDTIAPWNQLSIAEQRNKDNIDSVKLELLDDVVNVRSIDELGVYLESSAQIDWTNSELYMPQYAVRQVPWEG